MRQELRTDGPTHGKIDRHQNPQSRHAKRHRTVEDGPSHAAPIARGQKLYDRVGPFAHAFTEQETCEHRRQDHGKHQRAQQRKGDRPRHGLEQTPFHPLQGKDRQIGRDDDANGVKHRALHLVGRLADNFSRGFRKPVRVWRRLWTKCRTMFSTITTAPSTTIPKSSAPRERRFANQAPAGALEIMANAGVAPPVFLIPRLFTPVADNANHTTQINGAWPVPG